MTVFASSNFKTLAMREDASDNYGGNPGSGETLQYIPYTSESFAYQKESTDSSTITQSRQKQDSIDVGFDVNGGFEMEWAPMAYDQFIEGACWKRWGTATDVSITATIDADAKTITASADTPFTNLVAGQFVKISGANNAANNQIIQIDSVTDTVITAKDQYTLVDETSTATVSVKGCMIQNAKTSSEEVRISYFVERSLQDMDPVYRWAYRGLMVNSISMSAQTKAILTGSIDFLGKDSLSYSDGSKSQGSLVNAVSTEKLNAAYHIGGIRIDGVDLRSQSSPVFFQSLDFTINDNLRGLQAVGEVGNIGVSAGDFTVEGSFSPYFSNDTMYQKFLNGTAFSLSYEAVNPTTGEGYVFYFPRCKVQDSGLEGSGKNADIMENVSWTALEDPTTQITVQIDRFLADYTAAPDDPTVYTG